MESALLDANQHMFKGQRKQRGEVWHVALACVLQRPSLCVTIPGDGRIWAPSLLHFTPSQVLLFSPKLLPSDPAAF